MTPSEETSQPNVPDPPMPTPIVIKLSPGGFRFCGLDDAVEFDFDADGLPETTTWMRSGWDGAFLVLDRNGNGEVDDGTELFGNFTNQPPSEEPNGFRALAVFDGSASGGNEDGRISAADLIFPFLRLWKDSNHDGISQPSELVPLSWRGVVAIGLDTLVSGAQDRHGNLLRWRSLVDFETRTGLAAVDVIFVLAE